MKINKQNNKFQRDAFIDTLYQYAKKDKKILLLSNDQGAIALDNFREKIPNQYINVGVSEQILLVLLQVLPKKDLIALYTVLLRL